MVILSVDYGDTRTGLAICDAMEMLASPLEVITERDFVQCIEKVACIAREKGVGGIVVGYPKNMNNSIGERAQLCTQFAQQIETLTAIPTILWDERGTTVTAHQYLNTTNTRGKKRKSVVDAVAAVIILENVLSYRAMHKDVDFKELDRRISS